MKPNISNPSGVAGHPWSFNSQNGHSYVLGMDLHLLRHNVEVRY